MRHEQSWNLYKVLTADLQTTLSSLHSRIGSSGDPMILICKAPAESKLKAMDAVVNL